MSSGVQLSKNGAFYGTGANIDVRTVGFRPRRVELYNEDGLCSAVWTDDMANAAGLKQITAGTMSKMTLGVTPLSDGFRLGADTDLNVAGEKVYWVAHE